jgi:hypothetical protein
MGKSFSYNVETVTFRGAILAVIYVRKYRRKLDCAYKVVLKGLTAIEVV